MRILALDQATRSGWAFGVEYSQEPYQFGSFRMPRRDDPGERLVIFQDSLEELIQKLQPDLVGYETPFLPLGGESKPKLDAQGNPLPQRAAMNVDTIRFLHNLQGVLICTTARHSIPTESYPSSSWRKTALGMGRLPFGAPEDFKTMMIKRARLLGYDVKDDNEADALGILIHMLQGPPAAARAQGDLLDMASAKL